MGRHRGTGGIRASGAVGALTGSFATRGGRCPSSRVAGKGCFGAALMMEPQLVADSCAAMDAALREAGADIPITVKCRLGAPRSSEEALAARHTPSRAAEPPATAPFTALRWCVLVLSNAYGAVVAM